MSRLLPVALALLALAPAVAALAQDPSGSHGQEVFELWCSSCHKPLGPLVASVAGTTALARKYKGSDTPAALEQRTDLTPDLIKSVVRHGLKSMPFFRKTEVSDSDLDALAAYLSHSNK